MAGQMVSRGSVESRILSMPCDSAAAGLVALGALIKDLGSSKANVRRVGYLLGGKGPLERGCEHLHVKLSRWKPAASRDRALCTKRPLRLANESSEIEKRPVQSNWIFATDDRKGEELKVGIVPYIG